MKPPDTQRITTQAPSPSPATAVFLVLLFIAATFGAWSWFHVGNPIQPPEIVLGIRRVIPGFGFSNHPLNETERQILATTNLFNGDFTNGLGNRYTVFFAEWRRESGPGFLVLHTPDVCWVSAGAVPRRMGQPEQVTMEVDGKALPFECRAYEMPEGHPIEATLWCTLVGGRPMPENPQADAEYQTTLSRGSRIRTESRRRMWSYFLRSLRDRTPALECKQFARFSTPLRGDATQTFERLRHFGESWLYTLPPGANSQAE
ncbi:MAG: hypothetical protein EXS36_09400 [Pedosphaera sp.]|nr:hypothetical protein [Pedosphaera sp.]